MNSILCSKCGKLCHRRYTGLSFFNGIDIDAYICTVCSVILQRPVKSDESIALDRGTIEGVKEACYLIDMVYSEGGA